MLPTKSTLELEVHQPVSFSIQQFCTAHNISVSHYYALRAQGLGPKEMILGSRRIISAEAAAEWRAARSA
jgi:hypothetical protein